MKIPSFTLARKRRQAIRDAFEWATHALPYARLFFPDSSVKLLDHRALSRSYSNASRVPVVSIMLDDGTSGWIHFDIDGEYPHTVIVRLCSVSSSLAIPTADLARKKNRGILVSQRAATLFHYCE